MLMKSKSNMLLTAILVSSAQVYAADAPPADAPAAKPETKTESAAEKSAVKASEAPTAKAEESKPAKDSSAPAESEKGKTPAAAALNLSGKWISTEMGKTTIEHKDNKVSGVYEYVDEDDRTVSGVFEGELKDKQIQAKWTEHPKVGSGEEERGVVEWKVSDDGKMIVGKWRTEEDKEWQGDWNLERK